MPEHKMVTIDGVRYRPEDVARARARAGTGAGALTVADAHLPGSKTTDPEETAPDAEAFDPAEHTVLQVIAHLAEADEEETARVLDREASGEKRKGLLERREEFLLEAQQRAGSGGGA
ncbi:hypothetical protein NW249_34645 [Streptomyces sp. OUCMDZ-4982]|uniref:hypothetical protein n=1 Tax=Streptomyces sp. OUCMDZ-4982 TaxID=2973090 RepID=UPI00215BB418|nr:hypothetical protein [Streptomyces sp. OUCMDZ-4982]MCR8947228.1 hypothetical protein [Streptomyces sp. OUCMDZ-4982]